jgi:hypothetical protein
MPNLDGYVIRVSCLTRLTLHLNVMSAMQTRSDIQPITHLVAIKTLRTTKSVMPDIHSAAEGF